MVLSYKVYEYKQKGSKSGFKAFYLTLNGIQFGPIHFSLREINESIEKLKRGEKI